MGLIAQRIQTIGTENAFKLGDNIAECVDMGMEVIRFNLGEPDFDTPPHICEEAARHLNSGNTHYCPPHGIPSLRQAVARHVSETRDMKVDAEQVCITSGAKPPIGYSVLTYVEPGDEVIYPSPGFPIYESWITFVGATPVPLHLDDEKNFEFSADELARLITDKTKLIFINSPSNPTGGVLPAKTLGEIAEIIRGLNRDDIRIYSDEVYEDILFDGEEHVSIASFDGMAERTILVSGHSKSYAMTGWRLGYAILPTQEEHAVFKNLNINGVSCTPPFVQEGGRVALEDPRSRVEIARMVTEFQLRRDYAVPALNEIEGITCANPKGAFYVFPNIRGVCESLGIIEAYENLPANLQATSSPSRLFQMFLLYRYGVATMDRNSFGSIGTEGKHFLRLSTATDIGLIRQGISQIRKAASDVAGFQEFLSEGEHL